MGPFITGKRQNKIFRISFQVCAGLGGQAPVLPLLHFLCVKTNVIFKFPSKNDDGRLGRAPSGLISGTAQHTAYTVLVHHSLCG